MGLQGSSLLIPEVGNGENWRNKHNFLCGCPGAAAPPSLKPEQGECWSECAR